MAPKPARLWVIAGPNGAGKSSLVGVRFSKSLPIVNRDDTARDLLGSKNGAAEAGRMAVAERRRLMDAGVSFGIETTLSGVGVLRFMAKARAAGGGTRCDSRRPRRQQVRSAAGPAIAHREF